MEDALLHQFDHLIARKGYTNRSEAVRDIVRDKLVEESIEMEHGNVFGALVFIYDHHKRELEKSLSNLQHDYFQNIISTSHVHVDHDHCLEVVLLKGNAKVLKNITEKLLSYKGVKHGRLILTAALQQDTHLQHSPASGTPHRHHHRK
jgi:CopG family nickel-responsive transcriptional regulator